MPEKKTIPKLAANMDGILSQIVDLRGGKPTAIRVTTLYNDRIDDAGKWDNPGVVVQGRSNLRHYFEAVNKEICKVVDKYGAARCRVQLLPETDIAS